MENVKELQYFLKRIEKENAYKKDRKLINDLYKDVIVLHANKDINVDMLDKINEKIKYLDIEYDDLDELVILYTPLYIKLKEEIHKKEVAKLREKYRKEKEVK